MRERESRARFEALALPHLEAAYDLARWLTRDDRDAEDAVQEAYLRAFRYFDGLRGADVRPWLLRIVRNACHDVWRKRSGGVALEPLDDELALPDERAADPEADAIRSADAARIGQALEALPLEFREVVVLFELEGLSYRQIAEAIDAPIGTVMSRLSRARARLKTILLEAR